MNLERPQHMLWQFHEKHTYDAKRTSDGLKLMAWGFFKKLVIADNLALLVNAAYKAPNSLSGLSLLIATYFFAFQIFCDFSGYTDIARGASKVMGIELMENFKRPYFSKTISEFWKRWHISLSSWFSDYVYISLGGNRCVKWRWYCNLMIVFLLSIRQKISHICRIDSFPLIQKVFKVFVTFNLVCFSWIFFRATSLRSALSIIKKIFTDYSLKINFGSVGITRYQFVI